MRLITLKIDSWRHLRDVCIEPSPDASLVCLTGENGSGKSAVLELIAALCNALGFSSGLAHPRANPFDEPHEFSVTFEVPDQIYALVYARARDTQWIVTPETVAGWDKTITATYSSAREREMRSGGDFALDRDSGEIAHAAINALSANQSSHYLYVDANRSYPRVEVPGSVFIERTTKDLNDHAARKTLAVQHSASLYTDWIKYCMALEATSAFGLTQQMRTGAAGETVLGDYVDPFQGFRAALAEVLPGLRFIGPDLDERTLLFDSGGARVPFHHLSGGERELAFLIGHVERFQLHAGLLVIDEPELHLNPDLVRRWLSYLHDSNQGGQVWFATHSLEAVEVAGSEATYLFERDRNTYDTTSVHLLSDRPLIASLAQSLGYPAFTLSTTRFVYIEGEKSLGERARFDKLAVNTGGYRFVEGGGCADVIRRVEHARHLADETDEQLRIGGIVDRDFRTDDEVAAVVAKGLHVLDVHEVENFLLHPAAGDVVARRLTDEPYGDRLTDACDHFAGMWLLRRATHRTGFDCDAAVKSHAHRSRWSDIDADPQKFTDHFLNNSTNGPELGAAVSAAIDRYRLIRTGPDLWKHACGKEVLKHLAMRLGLQPHTTFERQILEIWTDGTVPVPTELQNLRSYLAGI